MSIKIQQGVLLLYAEPRVMILYLLHHLHPRTPVKTVASNDGHTEPV